VVVEPTSGKILLNLSEVNDACFHPNEQEVWYLSDEVIRSVTLATGKDREVFTFPSATNCLTISPDGQYLALSHKPAKDFLDTYVNKKGQKKNYKIYEKFRQCISVFNTSDQTLAHLANEMVDIPYVLK
jgi:WD40 repeat protein